MREVLIVHSSRTDVLCAIARLLTDEDLPTTDMHSSPPYKPQYKGNMEQTPS